MGRRRRPLAPDRSGRPALRSPVRGVILLVLVGTIGVPSVLAASGRPAPPVGPVAAAATADPVGTLTRELAAAGTERDGFIVVLDAGGLHDRVLSALTGGRVGDAAARVRRQVEATGGRVSGSLDGAVPALVVDLSEAAALALAEHDDVRWVSVNATGDVARRRSAVTSGHDGDTTLLWGRSVLDSRAEDWPASGADYHAALDRTYRTSSDGEGVVIHVVDTGVHADHPELAGRVLGDADLPDDLYRRPGDTVEPDADCNGHGTHVAATAAGRSTGVAPAASVVPVKVTAGCGSLLNAADIIAGLDWVAATVAARPDRPTVVNVSVGLTSVSSALDATVEALASDVPVILAAGNDDRDVAGVSPAGVATALTVGALGNSGPTFRHDQRAVYSNHGAGVDLFAPGTLVHAACVEPNRFATAGTERVTRPCTEVALDGRTVAVTALTGTSMAAPHVAGIAARYVGLEWARAGAVPDAAEVRTAILDGALAGVIDTAAVPLAGAGDRVLNALFLEPPPVAVGMPSVVACGSATSRALVQLPAGGIAPLVWEVIDGALPTGLTLAGNGQISGSAAGATTATGTVTIRVTDVFGRSAVGTFPAASFVLGC